MISCAAACQLSLGVYVDSRVISARRESRCLLAVIMIASLDCTPTSPRVLPDGGSGTPVATVRVAPLELAGVVVSTPGGWISQAHVVAHFSASDGDVDSVATISNARGLFRLLLPKQAQLSDVTVSIAASGFASASYPHLVLSGPVGHAIVFALRFAPPPQPLPVIAFSLPPMPSDTVPPGSLSGVVVDDTTGRGVAGAKVFVRVGTAGADVGSEGGARVEHMVTFRTMKSVLTDSSAVDFTLFRIRYAPGNSPQSRHTNSAMRTDR